MTTAPKKTLMRSLGEFFGHIVHAVRSNPSKQVIRKDTEETRSDDGVILRRTTIEEIEIDRNHGEAQR
jgi:hypothetical protein